MTDSHNTYGPRHLFIPKHKASPTGVLAQLSHDYETSGKEVPILTRDDEVQLEEMYRMSIERHILELVKGRIVPAVIDTEKIGE